MTEANERIVFAGVLIVLMMSLPENIHDVPLFRIL